MTLLAAKFKYSCYPNIDIDYQNLSVYYCIEYQQKQKNIESFSFLKLMVSKLIFLRKKHLKKIGKCRSFVSMPLDGN